MKNSKKQTGITLIALIVTIIVLLILAGVSLSLVAGGNGIIGKAVNAVNETNEKTAVEEIELVIAEANMQYYLDENVTNETLAKYLAENFSSYTTGSGAEITFNADGTIQYEGTNGDLISLEMGANGKVEITAKADGSKITKTVTYNANGGTGNVSATQNVERNATVNVDFTTLPTREGYQFLGWATSNNATSAQYTQSGTTSFTMGTSNVTLYAVWSNKAVDMIKASNYGDVADYTANGVTEWKVFLNDGNNVYLIASDYVPRSKLTLTADVEAGNGNYCVKGTTSRDELVSWLTTSSNWSEFAKGMSGATATGGPTLSQFWDSYNKKYETTYSAEFQDLSSYTGYDNTLYFPHKASWNSSNGYWLASPHSSNSDSVLDVSCNVNVGDYRYDGSIYGIRPLVCLPTEVKGIEENDGIWTFSN